MNFGTYKVILSRLDKKDYLNFGLCECMDTILNFEGSPQEMGKYYSSKSKCYFSNLFQFWASKQNVISSEVGMINTLHLFKCIETVNGYGEDVYMNIAATEQALPTTNYQSTDEYKLLENIIKTLPTHRQIEYKNLLVSLDANENMEKYKIFMQILRRKIKRYIKKNNLALAVKSDMGSNLARRNDGQRNGTKRNVFRDYKTAGSY